MKLQAKVSRLLVLFLCLDSNAIISAQNDDDEEEYVYRWSSTGGGWRAMFACVGFANVFQQAGILNAENSRFSAIATTSGASWFSTQLFYSQAFFDQTAMASTPDELYDFTIRWMETYYEMSGKNFRNIQDSVNITDLQPDNATTPEEESKAESVITLMIELFQVISDYDGTWADFVKTMLNGGAKEYGHQGGDFHSIVANAENRLAPFRNTDLLIQSALDPTKRHRLASNDSPNSSGFGYDQRTLQNKFGINATTQDWFTYMGPFSPGQDATSSMDDWQYYTVPIPLVYVVNETYTGFQYATFDSESTSDVSTYASPTSTDFSFLDLETYTIYPPPDDAKVLLTAASLVDANTWSWTTRVSNLTMTPTGTMPRPFGGNGQATVLQLAAMSSAAAGLVSPASPSVFSQALSAQRDTVLETVGFFALIAFDIAVGGIYEAPFWDNVAVCAQWPNPCGPTDGYLIDGAFVDNPAFAMNIAQYQHQEDADLSKTLRVVLTDTNQKFNSTGSISEILQYFQTDFNEGVAPGEYVWPPGLFLPRRSLQIFQEPLDKESLKAKLEPPAGKQHDDCPYQGDYNL